MMSMAASFIQIHTICQFNLNICEARNHYFDNHGIIFWHDLSARDTTVCGNI